MATIPKPPKEDRTIPGDRDRDVWRRQEIDINERQKRINESDDTFMQAPDKIELWLQKYKTALEGINNSYSSTRRSGVPMRVRQRNAIP